MEKMPSNLDEVMNSIAPIQELGQFTRSGLYKA